MSWRAFFAWETRACALPHGTMFIAENHEVRELNRIIERARRIPAGSSGSLAVSWRQGAEGDEHDPECLVATLKPAASARLLELECAADHRACNCRDEDYRKLQEENARLREALIKAGRAIGCRLDDNMSAGR